MKLTVLPLKSFQLYVLGLDISASDKRLTGTFFICFMPASYCIFYKILLRTYMRNSLSAVYYHLADFFFILCTIVTHFFLFPLFYYMFSLSVKKWLGHFLRRGIPMTMPSWNVSSSIINKKKLTVVLIQHRMNSAKAFSLISMVSTIPYVHILLNDGLSPDIRESFFILS